MKKYKCGFLYFYVHLIVEIVSFYILTSYVSLAEATIIALLYDFLAFVPQGLFGYLKDNNIKIPLMPIGIGLCLISLVLFKFNVTFWVIVIILAIGNALLHVSGAERTLRTSKGKMTNSALFVGGGSFGVLLGKIASTYNWNWFIILGLCLTMLIPMIFLFKDKIDYEDMTNLNEYNFSNKKIKPFIVIILATTVVMVRSYIGYGIPTSWNKELYQMILLYCFMGLGKCLGGILVDTLGIKITSLISTLGAIPFLVFGDKIMVVSLIGVMMFSLTMPITLALLTSVMKDKPGVAFGFTTIGLFLGTLPVFFFTIDSFIVNIILIIVLSALCAVILFFISNSRKENKNE